jgi:hypothetical protein
MVSELLEKIERVVVPFTECEPLRGEIERLLKVAQLICEGGGEESQRARGLCRHVQRRPNLSMEAVRRARRGH